LIIEPNAENVFNGMITRIPKLILSPQESFFKLVVNVMIVLLICKAQISESFYCYKRIRYYCNNPDRNGEARTIFDFCLYWFLTLMIWVDLITSCRVIQLTDLSAQIAVSAPKMILSLCSVKILTEFDDIVAGAYVKLLVRATDDGCDLLKFKGYNYKAAPNENAPSISGKVAVPNNLFYQYNDAMYVEDIRAVSCWCLILLYLIFMREFFRWLSLLDPETFYNIDGYTWDFLVPVVFGKDQFDPEFLV